jgi:putative transposase
MSAVGNPYDNAKAESFFKTLKSEEVYLKQYQSFAEAEANVQQCIKEVYNAKRLYSSLGYMSPVEFESLHSRDALLTFRVESPQGFSPSPAFTSMYSTKGWHIEVNVRWEKHGHFSSFFIAWHVGYH